MFHMVRNLVISETDLLADLTERTRKSLPPDWTISLNPAHEPRQPDILLELSGPDGRKGFIAIECKRRLDPKDVHTVFRNHLAHSADPLMVLAPFLSQTARDRLIEVGVSFADGTGN